MRLAKLSALKPYLLLFLLGFIGVLSMLPLVPQLIAMQAEKPPVPLVVVQAMLAIQSAVPLLLMVWIGAVFSKRVGLNAPVIFTIARSESFSQALQAQIRPAMIGGIAGGLFLVTFYAMMLGFLPAEFIAAAERVMPPWYTKLLYGGITEEVLIRWGLMSFLVWAFYRLTQAKNSDIKSHNFILAIIVSSLMFSLLHLPWASTLSATMTPHLVFYVIFGNSAFGLVAGYLYWKRGLECAIGAHMIAHITMIAASGLV